MTGPAHWIVLVPLVAGAVLIAALLAASWWARGRGRVEVRAFVCPALRRRVDVVLAADAAGRFTDVLRCSGLARPEEVGCGKGCVGLLNVELGRARATA